MSLAYLEVRFHRKTINVSHIDREAKAAMIIFKIAKTKNY